MRYTRQVEIAAPTARVWSVLADVERWPTWTPTVTALEALDGAGRKLRTGDRVRIEQPGTAPTVYTVTDVDDGRRFAWQARRPGLRQAAGHEVEALGPASTRVTLTFTIDGPVGRLVSPLLGGRVRRMVDTEATALRERIEAGAPDHGR